MTKLAIILGIIKRDIEQLNKWDSSYMADLYWQYYGSSPASRTLEELIKNIETMVKNGL